MEPDVVTTTFGLEGVVVDPIVLSQTTQSSGIVSMVNVWLGLLIIFAFMVSIVLWVCIFSSIIRRTDLKKSKVLWVLLLLCIAPVGMIAYGIVENRKYFAWLSFGVLSVAPIAFVVYALVAATLG
jgi:hypothetical protein